MQFFKRCMPLILLWLSTNCHLYAQEQPNTSINKALDFPDKLFSKINDRFTDIENKLIKQTEKSLQRLAKQEQKLRKRLAGKDSAAANAIFGNAADSYTSLQKAIQSNDQLINTRKAGDYLPEFDSAKTMLSFLQENPQLCSGKNTQQLQQALNSTTGISGKLKQVAEIRKILKNRTNLLSAQLSKYGLSSQLKRFNKEVYYYNQYIKQYKSLLNDPSRMEQAALSMLNKIPAFNAFVEKNSFLASLFPSSGNLAFSAANGTTTNLPGLQTRAQVSQLINPNMIQTGSGQQDLFGPYASSIKQEISKLKDKSSSWNEDAEIPNFKPNEMKTKSFWGKLEPGFNFQFGRSNSLLPTTADLGAQIAYRFHQNGSFGIGTAYKLGMGNIRRIAFSHQGISARSFFDYKLKGTFFANAGFEYNYNTAFKDINELKEYDAWQSSALAGISKKYKISKKFKGNVILLYDFLHKQHLPNTQPFVFRFGYNF